MKIMVELELNEKTLKFLESEGYIIYAKKTHPEILGPGEPAIEKPSEKEATVKRLGKDLDITFSSQEIAEEWRNKFASMMEQEGYHLSRERPIQTTSSENP
jgi:hypothetical protein